MEKYFCSYTQSLSLKELGFEKECLASISVDMGTYIPSKGGRYKNTNFNNNHTVSNPLKSQAFGFFRDKFKLHCSITSISQESWQWHVKTIGKSLGTSYHRDFSTFEEAENASIDKLIELCKTPN